MDEDSDHGNKAETLSPLLPVEIEELAARVCMLACDREWMMATAESCTGGLLASMLTDIAGASHAFDRGFVVYSEQAKQEVLGVSSALLAKYGAVSRPVAEAMARGAIERSGAALAVAITGYADDGDPQGEAGLVHFALARRHGDRVDLAHREEHFGDRGRGPVRIACLRTALRLLADALECGAG